MENYDDVADILEKIASAHGKVAELLTQRHDPEHDHSNATLAQAEKTHASACIRAAKALRGRSVPVKRPKPVGSRQLRKRTSER